VLITQLSSDRPKMTEFENEIGVRQAAELLGVTRRRVQAMCDEGVLREGSDWRKSAALGPNGTYWIKFASVMRLRGE
jgi:plasmid maintenance system antidote protein VapI